MTASKYIGGRVCESTGKELVRPLSEPSVSKQVQEGVRQARQLVRYLGCTCEFPLEQSERKYQERAQAQGYTPEPSVIGLAGWLQELRWLFEHPPHCSILNGLKKV